MIDAIKKLINKINEKSGTKSIQIASEKDDCEYVLTPWVTLNKLVKGFPKARFATIAGPSQTGKTALLLQTIAYNQKIDKAFLSIWTDFEGQFDKSWATRLGVDLDRLILQEYDPTVPYMEPYLDSAIELVKSGHVALWVIDSIGAMRPKGDAVDKAGDKSLEDGTMLNLQRQLGKFYNKANIAISATPTSKGCSVVLIGHVYQVPTTSGAKLEEVKGGNSVKHWANIRLLTRRGPKADWPKEITTMGIDGKAVKIFPGWSGRIKLDKTRQNANEGQEILLNFYHGRGFDWKDSTVSAALGLGIITRAAASYSCDLFPDGKLRGIEAVQDFFEKNEPAYIELAARVDKLAIENVDIKDLNVEEDDEDNGN